MASLFIGVILLIAIEKGPVVLRKGQSGIAHKVANRRKAEGSRQKAEVMDAPPEPQRDSFGRVEAESRTASAN